MNGENLNLFNVSGSYGCPNCGSKDIEEIGNNHRQTKDEMEYLEYCRCLKCKHEFVE
jgi:DNA-directed RNA polymerase subunit RPC12/RpoP